MEARLNRAEGFSAWSSPAPIWLKEAPSTRGALDRFFPQAPCSLFANDPVGYIGSISGFPSRGLASRGPASPGEQDHLEPLPLNSWVCTTHHHHPETTQPQKGYPLRRLGLLVLVNLGFRLFHHRGESCSPMEARFIV